ncbi:MAG: SDR family NAD(P)-dependent oxidoreductase [Pseudomonadales bacterium]
MKDLFSISGKVALVTGGSRGIGEMIARGYVVNGVKTYISSRKAEVCEQIAAELSREGECIAVPADLSSMEGVDLLAAEIGKRESKLDILVNNAGATWGASIDDFPESGWDKVMDLNVKSPFFLTQRLLPQLRAAAASEERARVINIGSIDGINTPAFESYSYSASKAGIIHLTRHLAKFLAKDGINVTAVAPGPFPSKMMAATLNEHEAQIAANNPCGRVGKTEDMAGVAIFLASAAGAYVNGVTIPVDGGITATLGSWVSPSV